MKGQFVAKRRKGMGQTLLPYFWKDIYNKRESRRVKYATLRLPQLMGSIKGYILWFQV